MTSLIILQPFEFVHFCGLLASLDRDRFKLCGDHVIGDDLIRGLLEQDLSALCRGLQALGEVDRVADRGVVEKLRRYLRCR